MGRAYGVLPGELADRCYLSWLVRELRLLQREAYDDFVMQVQGVEIGLARALGAAFGEKMEPLPRWEEVMKEPGKETDEEEEEWIQRYREANRIGAPVAD